VQPNELEGLSRSELILRAEAAGVERASVLTRAELVDEIIRRRVPDPIERRLARGLLGMARDLVARVVERGLHLPDAAARIRSTDFTDSWRPARGPIATVTLAEIYAAQGHKDRAIAALDEVLAREPDHLAARELRDRIAVLDIPAPVLPPEPDEPLPEQESQDEPLPEPQDERPDAEEATEPVCVAEELQADSLVIVAVRSGELCARWELGQASLDALSESHGPGELVLRLAAVVPRAGAPVVEGRDRVLGERIGGCVLRGLPARAIVRAAVGWRSEARFEPLAVALRETPREARTGEIGAAAADRARLFLREHGAAGALWEDLQVSTDGLPAKPSR